LSGDEISTSDKPDAGILILAEPSKLTPAIVLDVASLVAVAARPSILVIPVRTKEALALFNATAVVPIKTVELANVPEGIVPVVNFDADNVVNQEGLEYVPVVYIPSVTVAALPEMLPVKNPVTSPTTLPERLPVNDFVDAFTIVDASEASKLPVILPVTFPVKEAVIVPAAKLPDEFLATIVDGVFNTEEFNPSRRSASKPVPDPSTVLNFERTSAAV
jgi:hypothetical protein